jgi:kynurenine formamidase
VQAVFEKSGKRWVANLNVFWDLSVSTGPRGDNPSAFYIAEAVFDPIRVGGFVGSVAEGGSANCEVLTLCAHGNGTHTECVGHITTEKVALGDVLKQFWFDAQVVTVDIRAVGFVRLADVKAWSLMGTAALVVRSLPNAVSKRNAVWSGNDAPYFEPEALAYLRDQGIMHLLTDFPSVDPEEDEGRLSAHHEWWGVPQRVMGGNVLNVGAAHPRLGATITELIYVSEEVIDGLYFLNLQVPNLRTDAVPSRPILFACSELS